MSIFKRNRSPIASGERIRLTKIHLDQQRGESSSLRREIESVYESSVRSKMLLEEITQSSSSHDRIIVELTSKLTFLRETLQNQEGLKEKLAQEIETMKGTNRQRIPTAFSLSTFNDMNVQEILNKTEKNQEIICFKDFKGKIWELAKQN